MPDPGRDAAAAEARPSTAPPPAAPHLPAGHGLPGVPQPPSAAPVRLGRDEAERVIARALELQQDAQRPGDDALTLAEVEEVAAQVGVEPDLVRRALAEVRAEAALAVAADPLPSRTERLLGPHRIAGGTVLPEDPAAVRAASRRWMSAEEGMRLSGARGAEERWVKDARLLVGLRRGLAPTRARGALRDLREVRVAVEPATTGAGADAAVVRVEADTAPIRLASGGIAVASVLGGAAIGAATAAVVPDTAAIGSDLAQAALGFTAAAGAGVGTAVAVARAWTRSVRRAVDEALQGIAVAVHEPDRPALPVDADGWRRAVWRLLGGDR